MTVLSVTLRVHLNGPNSVANVPSPAICFMECERRMCMGGKLRSYGYAFETALWQVGNRKELERVGGTGARTYL